MGRLACAHFVANSVQLHGWEMYGRAATHTGGWCTRAESSLHAAHSPSSTTASEGKKSKPESPRRKQPRTEASSPPVPSQPPTAAATPTQHPLPLFPSRPAATTINAPQALVRASEAQPAPTSWRAAAPADDGAAATVAAAAPQQQQQQQARSLLQALLPQAHKPQAESVKREELARLFRHAAATSAAPGRTAATPAAAAPAPEAPAARPLVPPAPRVAVTPADVAAAAARRLHDAQMIALLQEGTVAQKKEAAFMALAHAKLPPVRLARWLAELALPLALCSHAGVNCSMCRTRCSRYA